MKLLLDTHLLIWLAVQSERLSKSAKHLVNNPENELVFSSVNIWEISIKYTQGRPDFQNDPRDLRRGLLDNGYREIHVNSDHALATINLPNLHKDPFDRMLLAQAITEGATLLTSDWLVAQYPGPIQKV